MFGVDAPIFDYYLHDTPPKVHNHAEWPDYSAVPSNKLGLSLTLYDTRACFSPVVGSIFGTWNGCQSQPYSFDSSMATPFAAREHTPGRVYVC